MLVVFNVDYEEGRMLVMERRRVGVLESTNTVPSNLKYNISMKGIVFTYHLA